MTFVVETVNLILEIGAGIVIFIAFCGVIYSLLKSDATLKSADTIALYMRIPVDKINGTAKSISYTISSHAIAGNIYLFVESPGVIPVGRT